MAKIAAIFGRLIVIGAFDHSKQAVLFMCNSGGKINSVAEREQIPQTIELERRSIGAINRFKKCAGRRVVLVDLAIAEVPNPKLVAVDQRQRPWGAVEFAGCKRRSALK